MAIRDSLNKHVHTYRSYNFVDKDPVIHKLEEMLDARMTSLAEVSRKSSVSESTLRNWFQGKTKRPQYASLQAIARAYGFSFELTQITSEKVLSKIEQPLSTPKVPESRIGWWRAAQRQKRLSIHRKHQERRETVANDLGGVQIKEVPPARIVS